MKSGRDEAAEDQSQGVCHDRTESIGNRSQLPVTPWFASRRRWRSVRSLLAGDVFRLTGHHTPISARKARLRSARCRQEPSADSHRDTGGESSLPATDNDSPSPESLTRLDCAQQVIRMLSLCRATRGTKTVGSNRFSGSKRNHRLSSGNPMRRRSSGLVAIMYTSPAPATNCQSASRPGPGHPLVAPGTKYENRSQGPMIPTEFGKPR